MKLYDIFGRNCARMMAFVSFFLFALAPAMAQQKPIEIEVSRQFSSLVLPDRPMLTWWDVKIPSSKLVVGKFKFEVGDGQFSRFSVMETEEMTLNGPEQRIRVMLPAIRQHTPINEFEIEVFFQGKNFSGSLGKHLLHVPFSKKRVFIGLVAESRLNRKKTAKHEQLMDALRFENVVPEAKAHRSVEEDREVLKTVYNSIDTTEFPSEPLAYCNFDMVILTNGEFQILRKSQLEALLAWVKAGGSLYLEPDGVLESIHVDFLRSIVADNNEAIVIQVDQAGKLMNETTANASAISVSCGVGHVGIRVAEPDQVIDTSSNEWRSIVRRLWKARSEPLETPRPTDMNVMYNRGFNRNGYPIPAGPNEASSEPVVTDSKNLAQNLLNRTRLSQKELLEQLMPRGAKMIPLSVLALILCTFVAAIGPGDYFVLGWLRMRKLTWVTFPLTSLLITTLTVMLSNSYLSTGETRRAVIVRDLGPTGEVVRTNRFELLFISSSRQVKTDIEKGLFASLKRERMDEDFNANLQSDRLESEPITERTFGRIPTTYSVLQNCAKWTPRLNRVFSIPSSSEKPNVDWNQFCLPLSESEKLRAHIVPERIVNSVHQQFGPSAMVACITGNQGWANDNSPRWRPVRSPKDQNLVYSPYSYQDRAYDPPEITDARSKGASDLFLWVYSASVGFPGSNVYSATSGIFSIVHQTTPKGNADCDDMPLLDSSDSEKWLLIIVVPEQDDFIVYRKRMRFE